MRPVQEELGLVADFLSRYYHEEPDDLEGTIEALSDYKDRTIERAAIATAFRSLRSLAFEPGALAAFVRTNANRFAQSDEQARVFLEHIYVLNLFDLTLESGES